MNIHKPVVLVVEDEELLRVLATDFFELGGYEVVDAIDGASAVAMLEARPDIVAVFTDVQMPGMPNGFGVARLARDASACRAIIVVSGRVSPVDEILAEGARFLQKPYGGAAMVKMFDDMLAGPCRCPIEGESNPKLERGGAIHLEPASGQLPDALDRSRAMPRE